MNNSRDYFSSPSVWLRCEAYDSFAAMSALAAVMWISGAVAAVALLPSAPWIAAALVLAQSALAVTGLARLWRRRETLSGVLRWNDEESWVFEPSNIHLGKLHVLLDLGVYLLIRSPLSGLVLCLSAKSALNAKHWAAVRRAVYSPSHLDASCPKINSATSN